MFFKEVC